MYLTQIILPVTQGANTQNWDAPKNDGLRYWIGANFTTNHCH